MKKIKIFLGSSIIEFEKERMLLENFIYRTSRDIFEENYNIKIEPLLCENMDNYVHADGTQPIINKELVSESDMCFFIIFTKIGKYTKQEFEIAFEKYKEVGKPKVYVYFKNVRDGEMVEDAVYNFMAEIDNKLKHYHGSFEHIDTIKLRILLNLKIQEMDFISVEFENGKCVVDGKETLDLSNVSEFANNSLLKQLKNEFQELDKKYIEMNEKFKNGEVSQDYYREYSEIASRHDMLLDLIEEIGTKIFNISLRLCKDEINGEITQCLKDASVLFEQGDYEGALQILDRKENTDDYLRRREHRKELQKQDSIHFIKQKIFKIDILELMKDYKEKFKDIEETYDLISKITEEDLVELYVLYEYASYLFARNQYKKALKTAKRLEKIYRNENSVSAYEKSALYLLLGNIYNSIPSKYQLAETYYLKAIQMSEELEETTKKQKAQLGTIYDSIAMFYEDHLNIEKAQYYFQEAINIYEVLSKENPEKYKLDLLRSYNNIGCFYRNQKNIIEASSYLKNAVIIAETLDKSTDDYNAYSATCYDNITFLYNEYGIISKAEYYHNKAKGIFDKLLQDNPEKHFANAALCYSSYAVFLLNQGKNNKAKESILKAIKLLEIFLDNKSFNSNSALAMCYDNFATIYRKIGNNIMAEDYHFKALHIYENLSKLDKPKYTLDLAICYDNIGLLYSDISIIKSGFYYIKALKEKEYLMQINPERFGPQLAVTYFNFSQFNEEYLDKAYQIAKKYPGDYDCREILKKYQSQK